MTISHVLKTFPSQLRGSSSPTLDIEVLLSHVLKKPKEYLFIHSEKHLSPLQFLYFLCLVNKRKTGTPIAYLTGHQSFFGFDLKVNKNVLIPRPETELLVEEVLNYSKSPMNGQWSIVDVGTGSGAIIVALAKSLPHTTLLGIDQSSSALHIAQTNATALGVADRIEFLHGNLLEPLQKRGLIGNNEKVIVVANLPYLSEDEMTEPSIQKEPRKALYGGPDGLDCYRKLFDQLITYQMKPAAIFLEIGEEQGQAITQIAQTALPEYTVSIKQDLCGLDRVVAITK